MDQGLRVFLALALVTTGLMAAILSRPPSPGCAPPVAEPDWLTDVPTYEHKGRRVGPVAPAAQIRAARPTGSSFSAEEARPEPSSDCQQAAQPPGLAKSYPQPHWISAWAEPAVGRGVADPWTPSTHIVQDGDTLPGLAARYLGDAARWPEILEANRDVLADPEALPVGIRLKLPASPRTPRSTGTVLQGPLVPVAPQIPNQAGASWAATGTPPGHASPRLPEAAGPVPP